MSSTILVLFCVSLSCRLHSQNLDTIRLEEDISVLARAAKDSVTLRWSPRNYQTWRELINKGVRIERFTIVRDNVVLTTAEKRLLTPVSLRPAPLDEWEQLVGVDNYAAVAAQAIFGDDFSMNLDQTEFMSIANKVNENEQRFGFALFSADMSPATASKSGLWFSDTSIHLNEKYLYRIIVDGDSTNRRGSVFVSGNDSVNLPSPKSLEVESLNGQVNLRWRQLDIPIFTWYKIERSIDTTHFRTVANVPMLTLSPTSAANTQFSYASDSLPDVTTIYYYRIRGVTPFGEAGPPSKVIALHPVVHGEVTPYILEAVSTDNSAISVSWEFSDTQSGIKGFIVERASKDKGPFINLTLHSPLSSLSRSFTDLNPESVNYYRVSAVGFNGIKRTSATLLATLVDSIPPSSPSALYGSIDDYGVLKLKWNRNPETDLFGYRVYKSNHIAEEAFQATQGIITDNNFSEKIELKSLNRSVYYSVVAIDRNQNHSIQSSILRVSLPDKVKPVPPIILPLRMDSVAVTVVWTRSSSEDVVKYDVFRAEERSGQWNRLKIIEAASDSVFSYRDISARSSTKYRYTIVAIDSSNNESDKVTAVSGGLIDNSLLQPIIWKRADVKSESKSVMLSWDYVLPNVSVFKVFKSLGVEQYSLFKIIPGSSRQFLDRLLDGQLVRYKIMIEFKDGRKSHFSEELKITF